jgi:hypothetical protein
MRWIARFRAHIHSVTASVGVEHPGRSRTLQDPAAARHRPDLHRNPNASNTGHWKENGQLPCHWQRRRQEARALNWLWPRQHRLGHASRGVDPSRTFCIAMKVAGPWITGLRY